MTLRSWMPCCYQCHHVGHWNGRISLSTKTSWPQREGKHRLEARFSSASAVFRDARFMSAPMGWEVWLRVVGTSQTRGNNHRPCCHYCPISYGFGHCYAWEAGAVCTASPEAIRFSEAVGSAAINGGLGSYELPLLSPTSTSSTYSSPLNFGCTDAWILWHPDVLCRVSFARLWIFYWLQI